MDFHGTSAMNISSLTYLKTNLKLWYQDATFSLSKFWRGHGTQREAMNWTWKFFQSLYFFFFFFDFECFQGTLLKYLLADYDYSFYANNLVDKNL